MSPPLPLPLKPLLDAMDWPICQYRHADRKCDIGLRRMVTYCAPGTIASVGEFNTLKKTIKGIIKTRSLTLGTTDDCWRKGGVRETLGKPTLLTG